MYVNYRIDANIIYSNVMLELASLWIEPGRQFSIAVPYRKVDIWSHVVISKLLLTYKTPMRFYDTQIKIRRIQVVFQEERPKDE